MCLIAQFVIFLWHICHFADVRFVFLFALFVVQNLATGAWGAVFCLRCTKTKKSQISLRLDLERKTRLELATPTLARLCSTN